MTRLMIEHSAKRSPETGAGRGVRARRFPFDCKCMHTCVDLVESRFYIFSFWIQRRATHAPRPHHKEIHARGEPNERPTHVRDCAHTLHAQHHHKCTERHIVQNGYTRGYPLSPDREKEKWAAWDRCRGARSRFFIGMIRSRPPRHRCPCTS